MTLIFSKVLTAPFWLTQNTLSQSGVRVGLVASSALGCAILEECFLKAPALTYLPKKLGRSAHDLINRIKAIENSGESIDLAIFLSGQAALFSCIARGLGMGLSGQEAAASSCVCALFALRLI